MKGGQVRGVEAEGAELEGENQRGGESEGPVRKAFDAHPGAMVKFLREAIQNFV